MSFILSIETSTAECSVALHDKGLIVKSSHLSPPQMAASQLSVHIDNLLKASGIKPNDLSAVSVSAGPGSYTGLRIGVSTAKGICFALDIPFIGIDSLLVLAETVRKEVVTDFICPMMDARRMEVYYCLMDKFDHIIEDSRPKVIDSESFQDRLADKTILFFGPGADKCKQLLSHSNAKFKDHIGLSAIQMGRIAYERFQENKFDEMASFEPKYLKEFEVKTKIPK